MEKMRLIAISSRDPELQYWEVKKDVLLSRQAPKIHKRLIEACLIGENGRLLIGVGEGKGIWIWRIANV